jgi:photosystem II stability/assembly factor-like uncharacterized protein
MTHRPLRNAAVPVLLCFLLALETALPAGAGVNRWTPFGPPNTLARILAVAVVQPGNPGILLAAPESGGVYRSLNEGRTWSWSGDGLPVGVRIDRLVVSPADPSTVYADGLYRSDDAGQHWTEIYTPRNGVEALVADPADPDVVYLADGPDLLRSRDRGETWERLFGKITVIQAIAIDPTDTDKIYIGNLDNAFRSTDGGVTWEVMDDVVSGPAFRGRVTALAIAPSDPRVIYMSEDAGLYRSTDGGLTWFIRSAGNYFLDLYVDPADPSTLYGAGRESADVLVSRDGGETWKPIVVGKPDITNVQDLAFAPSQRALYVATGTAGVAKIIRNGRLWQSGPQKGLPAELIDSLQFHPADPARIYVHTGSTDRRFESRDGGRTWRLLNNPPVPGAFFGDLIFDPPHPDTLYLANPGRVYRSQDDGVTWQMLSGYPSSVDLAFPAPRTIITAGCGIHLSTDAGRTFREVLSCQLPDDFVENDRILTDLRTDPGDRRTFYALGTVTTGRHPTIVTPKLYVSRDAGRTWTESLSGAQFLAIFPSRNGPLYAFETSPPNTRIRKSTDAGRTWETTSSTFPVPFYEVSDLEVDQQDPETLYLSTQRNGVFRSTDEGRTWTPLNAGLARFGWLNVHALVMHPVREHTLYALPQTGIFEGTFPP